MVTIGRHDTFLRVYQVVVFGTSRIENVDGVARRNAFEFHVSGWW